MDNISTDHPALPRNLISAFVIHPLESLISKFASSKFMIFHLIIVAEQAGLLKADNISTDQPAHPHSLISAFAIHPLESIISKFALSKFMIFHLIFVAEQAGLNFYCSSTLKIGFHATRTRYTFQRTAGKIVEYWSTGEHAHARVGYYVDEVGMRDQMNGRLYNDKDEFVFSL